jgi:putative tricarboxylic transport membrane protein
MRTIGAFTLCLALLADLLGPAFSHAIAELKLHVPAAPGGGWDQTARAMERALREEKLVTGPVRITNRAGAGGAIGLEEFAKLKGNGTAMLVMGLGMIGALHVNHTPVSLDAVTPIARLTSEPLVIAVPAHSRIQTLKEFTEALKKDPDATTIAGGPRGAAEHILAVLVAGSVGVPAARVNYVAFAGGGEATTALAGAQAAAGIGGVGDFYAHIEAKKLRPLGVTAPARAIALGVATLKDQGLDLDFGHWRGVMARAGITVGERKTLVETIEKMARSATWRLELKKHNWDDAFLAGDAYATFIRAENDRIGKVLKDVGLVR